MSLVGHYNKLTLSKQVDPRLLSRGFTEDQLKQMKNAMGKLPSEIISLDVHFKRDIESINVDYFNYAITCYDAYHRHGVLPYSGSLSEQPNKIIEIFNVLDALRSEREAKMLEEQRKEQTKNKKRK